MSEDVTTEVVAERGQWVVYLTVLSAEGVDRRRLEAYRTEQRARLAASVIARTTGRRRDPR